jgi:threonine dehydratase
MAGGCARTDTVLVAVGGGGLIAGIAAWYGRRVKVVGVEPEGSRALQASLEAGRPVDVPVESVAADSLGARNTGQRVYDIARQHVDHVALVADEASRKRNDCCGIACASQPNRADRPRSRR